MHRCLLFTFVLVGQTALAQQPWIDLLQVDHAGKLVFWQPMLDAPRVARLTAQQSADERSRQLADLASSWLMDRGELTAVGDGCGIETIFGVKDHILQFQWRAASGGDAVLYLKGSPAIRLRDSRNRIDTELGLGTGGLFLNQQFRAHPTVFADKPTGEWNEMQIMHKGDRVTVTLNGTRVVDTVPLEPFWDRTHPIPDEGSLGLGSIRGRFQFRAMRLKRMSVD